MKRWCFYVEIWQLVAVWDPLFFESAVLAFSWVHHRSLCSVLYSVHTSFDTMQQLRTAHFTF